MELHVAERLMLGMLLQPVASDIVTLRLVRALQEELSFSAEELEVLKFDDTDEEGNSTGRVRWNEDAPQTKEFDFSKITHGIIVEQLEKASKAKKLTLQQLALYERFCPPEEEAEEEGKEEE